MAGKGFCCCCYWV